MAICEIGDHVQPATGCKITMRNVKRIFMKSLEGDSSFDGGVNEAAYLAAVDTAATWATELGKTGVDTLVGTGEINNYDFPENGETVFTGEDGDILGSRTEGRTLTFKLYVPTEAAHTAYKNHNGKPVKFFLALRNNTLRIKKYVDSTTDVYFTANSCTVTDLVQNPSGMDYCLIKLHVDAGAMDGWHDLEMLNVNTFTV